MRDASRDGFETVALRPRFVWGKGDTTLLPEMVATVEAGKWAWVGGGYAPIVTPEQGLAELAAS